MANPVVNTSLCACTFGAAPAPLTAVNPQVLIGGQPAATVQDTLVPTFGMCSCPANPTVASATAAALGVLTPMPCLPALVPPWAPGAPTVLVGGKPLLNNTSKLMCAYGGVISVTVTPAVTVQCP